MELSYFREENRNYIVIEKTNSELGYQEKMLERSNVPYLLDTSIRHMDGGIFYYYDIKGMMSLKSMAQLKPLQHADIIKLFESIKGVLEGICIYMLSERMLILKPDSIFFDRNKDCFKFLCCTDYEEPYNFRTLTEFLLEVTDSQDDEAVSLVYEYYEMVENELTNPADLLTYKAEEKVEKNNSDSIFIEEKNTVSENEAESYYYREIVEEEESSVDGRTFVVLAICCVIIFIVGSGYIAVFLNRGILDEIGIDRNSYVAAGALLAAIFSLFLIMLLQAYNSLRRKRDIKDDTTDDTSEEEMSKDLSEAAAVDEIGKAEWSNQTVEGCNETVLLTDYKERSYTESNIDFYENKKRMLTGIVNGEDIYCVIRESSYIIGKDVSCDVSINAVGVSRKHARVFIENENVYLQDLGSTNGTAVNGEYLVGDSKCVLQDGDSVTIGPVVLIYTMM